MNTKPHIKICCISSITEAQMAISFGADALGLVGQMPSGPGIITDELINQIARAVPPPVASFLLTSQTTASGIIAHYQKVNTSVIQLVDAVSADTYHAIRLALPSIKLVQVIHVIDQKTLEEALAIAPNVDALLLDSGNPNLAIKELGGTGRTHNWALSQQIVARCGKPVFLAGGLNPNNVKEAIEAVKPFGLDLCSGVRTNNKLDPHKLEAFMKAVYA